MKPKVSYQIQPREVVSLRTEQVQEEIQSFLEAVDSYPARAAKEPGVSFHQHLRSIFAARNDRRDRPRPQ
jgi:hypothetical protein